MFWVSLLFKIHYNEYIHNETIVAATQKGVFTCLIKLNR